MLSTNYQLIDYGRGRKLENFCGIVLDRPCPAADGVSQSARTEWQKADLRFDDKRWTQRNENSTTSLEQGKEWNFCWKDLSLALKASPFGHVGVFPEQIENWEWMTRIGENKINRDPIRKPTALNLFAYTGGSTLALAQAGFEVTHVDASKPAVQWARRNAERSNASMLPIRWIVDDARDYLQRVVRRQQKYDFIVLDPPAFGHGTNGKRWELTKDISDLIENCRMTLSETPLGVLLTGHSPIDSMEFGPLDKRTFHRLTERFRFNASKRAILKDYSGRDLDCGYIYRWFN